ncbi:MAG: SusC/RagA family TonB-linked outer membrane protein [Flavobacteriaceae bacterium]|nr:SusC/RagA family TonB-linked outer membrane protein [Flavobacteriaceae bacterium]
MKNSLKLAIVLFLGVFQIALAQSTISGTIRDANGPLPGANVIEAGTNNGVSTDFDGNFEISVSDGASLEISYTGYFTQTIEVGNQSSFDVLMEEDTEQLDEVVVTSLGFTEKRDNLGSTYSVVSTGAVQRSGEATFANALSAKAAGLSVSRSSGDPGSGSRIRIRGANTILGSSEPLIIVDGSPLNSSITKIVNGGSSSSGAVNFGSRLNDITPADIASVQVLKGASAAALWGSRAANGVIVITTKEGQSGKAKITFSTTYSFDEISERIPRQNVWGQGQNGSYSPTRAESWGDYIPDRAGGADTVNTTGGFFTSQNGNVYYPITTKNSRETFIEENFNAAFQTGTFIQNDLNISGGNDKNTYFFSLTNLQQEGIIRGSTYDRTNIRFNYNAKLNDIMDLSNKVAYTYTSSNMTQGNSNVGGIQLGHLRTPADFDNRDYIGVYTNSSGEEFPRRHRSYRRYLGNNENPIYNNPLWTTKEQLSLNQVNRITVTPQLTIKPKEWLQLITRANIDFADDRRTFFFPRGSAGSSITINRRVGSYLEDEIATRDYNIDFIGRGEFSLTDNIDLTAIVGWSLNDRKYNRSSGSISDFLVNATKRTTALNSSQESSTFENIKSFTRSNRGYAILNFGISDELFVNMTGAVEASSTIKGSFFYPAADVAWNFTNSALDSSVISFGKLRASYGIVGVQPSPHRFDTLAEGGFSYSTYSDPLVIDSFGGGFRLDNNLGNPDLKPEIKTEWEIGTDLRFFNNDLTFSFTYYNNKIEDILLNVSLSPSSGFSTQYGNFGAMKNKGYEIDLGWNAIQKQDLNLNTTLNWSRNVNEVTDLYGTSVVNMSPGASVQSVALVGSPLGTLFGTGSRTNADGSFDLNENGFPQITSSFVVLGDPNPDWRAGLGLNLSYKKFNLNVVLEHSQGGEFSPRTLHVLKRFGTTTETANRVTLTEPLVNVKGTTFPAGTTIRGNIKNFGGGNVLLDEQWYRRDIGGGFGDNQAYNFSIYDATWTKLREISLSYTLDSPSLKSTIGLSSVRFTLTGRNLININNIPGIDPEVNQYGTGNALGLDYFTNPQTQSTLLGVTFNF